MTNWHAELDTPVTDPRIGRRLFGFVAASLLLHSAVMVSLPPNGETSVLATPPMHITLAAPAKETTQATKAPKTAVIKTPPTEQALPLAKAEVRNIPTPEPTQAEQTASDVITSAQPVDAVAVETEGTDVEQAVGELQYNQLKQLLRNAIAHQLHYPRLAHKRGWQGEVLVAFTLNTQGGISDERIVQHSGYSVLDRAALTTLQRVNISGAHIPEPLEYELPIPFHLIEG